MTRREAERLTHQTDTLRVLGFTREESEQLRRISMTLHRWYERECGDGNGAIERDDDTGKPYWHHADSGRRYPIADRERGAERRLRAIIDARNGRQMPICANYYGVNGSYTVSAYLQTDPRGASLYIIRPGDVPDGADVSGYYTRGICVY